MKIFSDFFPSAPFTVSFTPLIEIYGGKNLAYDDLDSINNEFKIPEDTAYYLASFDFNTPNMIDNTVFSVTTAFSGALHSEENSFHSLGTTLRARIGDHIELMLGYDLKLGNTDKAGLFDYPGFIPDRDAVSLGFTWYFM